MTTVPSKIKPIKTGKKKIKTTYCLGSENYTHNFKPQEVKMRNKVLRVKSNGVVGRTTKSTFLKPIYNNRN